MQVYLKFLRQSPIIRCGLRIRVSWRVHEPPTEQRATAWYRKSARRLGRFWGVRGTTPRIDELANEDVRFNNYNAGTQYFAVTSRQFDWTLCGPVVYVHRAPPGTRQLRMGTLGYTIVGIRSDAGYGGVF